MKKIIEKWSLWVHEQCTRALFMEDLVNNCGWKKKKKKRQKEGKLDVQMCYPNTH